MKSKFEQEFEEWMIKHWGKRCKDYEAGCGTCDAWKCYDFLLNRDKTYTLHDKIIELIKRTEKMREKNRRLEYFIDQLLLKLEEMK